MAERKGSFRTVYDSPERGTLAFERNAEVEQDILACLEIVRQIREDYKDQPRIAEGLRELETQLHLLRTSRDAPETVRDRLEALTRVPLDDDNALRLDAFRRSTARGTLRSEAEYVEQVRKMVRNTLNNAALLMLNQPNDPVLGRLVEELRGVDLTDYRALRHRMAALARSPQLWRYNEKKKQFLLEWLRPYQSLLGKPAEEMSEEEFQAALRKVESLRETRLEEMTHLMVEADRAPFKVHNRAMNPVVNGRDEAFWGGVEARDEFVALLNKLITRFSFNLEDRYLLFRTKDGGFLYLVGFADDAFDRAVTTRDGRLGLHPHLKVFVNAGEEDWRELTQELYNRNPKLFYSSLKTAVVPFLRAAAVMVEVDLSPELQRAFDMWT